MSAPTQLLFDEQQVRAIYNKRTRILISWLGAGTALVFLYLFAVGQVRDQLMRAMDQRFGIGAGDVTMSIMPLGAIAVFLAPVGVADMLAKRYVLACPHCQRELRHVDAVLSTKCCGSCAAQIMIGNQPHSHAAYRRAQRIRLRRFLAYWLWAWPVFAAGEFVWWCFSPVAALQCRIWVVPLIGTVASGYSWLRTFDRRYVWQLVSSVLLLAALGYLAWRA